ncbi:MAG: FtsW/RodA/SpoVE family cell cycle protein [Pseudomonadota bacterium]
MKKKLGLVVKLFAAVFIFLFVYRVFQKITEPRVLFQFCHLIFIVCLLAWGLLISWQTLFIKPFARIVELTEIKNLLMVSMLITASFVLTAVSFALRGRETSQTHFLIPYDSLFIQAFLYAGIFIVLIWMGHAFFNRKIPERDPCLYPLICFLAGVGLVFLFRLGPDLYEIRKLSSFQNLAWFQLRSIGISFFVLMVSVIVFSDQQLEAITRKRYIYVIVSIVLISLTAVIGTEINGRKLSLNFGIINFQTVEMVKIFALLFMVGYFRYERSFLESGKNFFNIPRMRYLMPYLIMWVLTLMPIFFQKDLGPTVLIFLLFVTVFYLGTGSWVSVLVGFIILVTTGIGAYFAQFPSMVKTRVDMWLDPFHYSQNLAEALWAVSEGGWFGTGLAQGFSHRIPVVQSDFNFAAIAEEWGFLGGFMVFWVICLLVFKALALARQTHLSYVQLFISGLAVLWLFQTLIIVGGNLGLMPLTGITLPFISYGGSSLLVNFMAAGIVLRFSHDHSLYQSNQKRKDS